MTSKTIIIATPNAAQSAHYSALIGKLAGFQVIARTGDLMNTYNQVEERLPAAVLISETLSRLPEFEVMRAMFSALDVRWLVLASPNKTPSVSGNTGSDLFSVPADSPAHVIEGQLRSLTRSAPHRLPPVQTGSTDRPNTTARNRASARSPARAPLGSRTVATPQSPASAQSPIILLGSSTGGVDALLSVLSSFDADSPPTLIVQHTGANFGASLAGLLDRQCKASVSLVEGPTPLRRGSVLIGAGSQAHLVLDGTAGLQANIKRSAPVSGHMPSVDVLFSSAVSYAPRISAAILTGMGRDGADGMLKLRNAGATTLAQDEASSVVYGMPRAAKELGAAQSVLPLSRIGPALLKAAQTPGRVAS